MEGVSGGCGEVVEEECGSGVEQYCDGVFGVEDESGLEMVCV